MISRATKSAATEVVVKFIEREVTYCFGWLCTIVSDNALWFTAGDGKVPMPTHRIGWRKVGEYASMSNGRAEQMIGTINRAVEMTPLNENTTCVQTTVQIAYRYGQWCIAGDLSRFQRV